MDGVGKQIALCDGIILEIGADPGGRYMPYIFKANPDAALIISDLSPTVVRNMKKIVYGGFTFPNPPNKTLEEI